MKAREIYFDREARSRLKRGLDIVADTVKVTIGPRGRNVLVQNGLTPDIVNDGGVIAEGIFLKDNLENMGAQIAKKVIRETSRSVGGGRTASAIMLQSVVSQGEKLIPVGADMIKIKNGMDKAVSDITDRLKKNARKITSTDQLRQVAKISTESDRLADEVVKIVDKVGKDGVVTVVSSNTPGITSEIMEGLEFNRGYISEYMITNLKRMEAEHLDVPILVTSRRLSIFRDILPLVQELMQKSKNQLVIVADDVDGNALDTIIANRLNGAFFCLAIKAPEYGEYKQQWLQDIAITVGAKVVDEHHAYSSDMLGHAKKVLSKKDNTIIVGAGKKTSEYIKALQNKKETIENRTELEYLEKRIARLVGGVAVMKVGSPSEEETKYLKLKLEDGINETKRALEEGVVVGGDIAFINATKTLKDPKITDNEEKLGYDIIVSSVEAPFRQILKNGQEKEEEIVQHIKDQKSITIGWDAVARKIESDMFAVGIIDALKVSRTVLQNAVSSAYMFLTIERAVVDEKEPFNPLQGLIQQ